MADGIADIYGCDRERMGAHGRRRAVDHHEWRLIVPRLVAEYIKKEHLYTGGAAASGGKARSREADHAPSGARQEHQRVIAKARL